MRIDYSEPKQAYVAAHGNKRPRKEPVGLITTIVIITGVVTFSVGFGTGWFFSQRAAKKAFQAATQQKSLENSPPQEAVQTATKPQSALPTAAPGVSQPPQQGAPNTQPASSTQTTPDPPLSFYKTLPSEQKGSVLGSGINTRDDKGKQPLQAAIPSNLSRPSQSGNNATKPLTTDKQQAAADKTQQSGFTVQVASYNLKTEAEAAKNKLAGKGYNVTVVESHQGDKGTWYRVRVGKRLEQDAAKELAGRLGKGAIVIPDRD